MSEAQEEFSWLDAADDLTRADDAADEEIDWDREATLHEIVGDKPERHADNLEDADVEVLDQMVMGFRERAGKEAERFAEVTLSDVYFVVCFATQAQREAYLMAKRWNLIGRHYIDGRRLAAYEGIELPPDPEWPQTKRDKTWDKYAMTIEENRLLTTDDDAGS